MTSTTFKKNEGVSESDITEFARKNAEVLNINPERVKIGLFAAPEDEDYISIDLNVVTEDRETALRIGRRFNQKSIFDADRMVTLGTGGTGDPVVENTEEVKSIVSEYLLQ